MRATLTRQAGLSLIELMIAITIGLFLLVGLVSVFATSNQTYLDLSRAAQQIENGRFAVQVISDDVAHAGFYGRYSQPGTIPAGLPDPCVNTVTPAPVAPPLPHVTSTLEAATALPLQGYDAPLHPLTGSAPTVSGCISDANHVEGTDILVVRRADSSISAGRNADGTDATTIPGTGVAPLIAGNIYVQANSDPDSAPLINVAAGAGDVAKFWLKNKDVTKVAPVRRYHVHIYFIAPCSIGTDTVGGIAGVCKAGDDSIPTLKRLELTSDGVMKVMPLVEGIENFQVDYGIDNSNPRDGVPDGAYVTDPGAVAGGVANWADVVAVRINVLARNVEASGGYTDTKQYDMGAMGTVSAPGAGGTVATLPANFKRHVYNAVIRVVNPASRRES